MIGNSHIDPVWFWRYEEGLQEVKATFASALDRMNEYEEFKFTSSSVAFYKWIEKILPNMSEKIKKAVDSGKWEIVGGWFVEPDCNLPSGEAFVRQGLYSQRYLKEKFGRIAKVGFNIDSFGHNSNLPQLLKKSGIDSYIFMRPGDKEMEPVFNWISKDGSSVVTCRLPGEYTTWFREQTVNNIEHTLNNMGSFREMVCFYGVGNHGGGPTKANIESIRELMKEYEEVELEFSNLKSFFNNIRKYKLQEFEGETRRINVGCYSVDSEIKSLNRKSETAAVRAEKIAVLPKLIGGIYESLNKDFEKIWEIINFNQFHDTLAGTAIKEARDEAVMQFGAVISKANFIRTVSIQNFVNEIDTRGKGFPLILFNTNGYELKDQYVEVELNWFCKAPLTIIDTAGSEVEYQRIKTSCTMINRNIGGRRRIIFKADIPPMGFSIYRLIEENPRLISKISDEVDNFTLENEFIALRFNKDTGLLCSLIDKKNQYEALTNQISHKIYKDTRDTWGHGDNSQFHYLGEDFKLSDIRKIETGVHRSVIRAIYNYGTSTLEQHYILYKDCDYVAVKNHLVWNEKHKLLKMSLPLNISNLMTRAEIPYSFIDRQAINGSEEFMHTWLNAYDKASDSGTLIINDSKYAYSINDNNCELTLVRSAIYAQGTCEGWYSENDTYRYTDQGEQDFTLIFKPHGNKIENYEAVRLSNLINVDLDYIADTNHLGRLKEQKVGFILIDKDNIMLSAVKQAEDDEDIVVRLYETDGIATTTEIAIACCKKKLILEFKPCEIKTIKASKNEYKELNLLEFGGD